ncbi:hypothetical protein GCM10010531_15620 [Blastococcus jejuensis]|uniref:SHOCT domain-containing protein n=1 Tax=Blastococcus jejuensis TaxID=351224 RepID=A0ABP6P3A5_9ACTN
MTFWFDHNLSTWGWVGMTIGMVAFWGLLIGGVVWTVRSLNTRDQRTDTSGPPGPEQLLAQRFALGEIDETEYHDRLTVLRGGERPTVRS